MITLALGCRTDRWDVIGIDPFAVPRSDLMGALAEIWRLCKKGALVYIRAPHVSSSYVTWVHPTHQRGMTIETFAGLDRFRLARFKMEYARLRFITANSRSQANPVRRLLASVMDALANHNRAAQYRCERWWGRWIGFDEVLVIIRAEKETPPPRLPGPRRRQMMAAGRTP